MLSQPKTSYTRAGARAGEVFVTIAFDTSGKHKNSI